MPARPNFTDVELSGNKVKAHGESAEADLADLIGIQVFVSQEDKAAGGAVKMAVAVGFVAQQGSPWTAEFDNNGLVAGPAVAIGLETHSEPFTAITWAQPVQIKG
jgi:hypothetical protein